MTSERICKVDDLNLARVDRDATTNKQVVEFYRWIRHFFQKGSMILQIELVAEAQ